MNAIINIVLESETIKGNIDITVRPARDAAENVMEAVSEYLADYKKDFPNTTVKRITIESETSGNVLADLNFQL